MVVDLFGYKIDLEIIILICLIILIIGVNIIISVLNFQRAGYLLKEGFNVLKNEIY